MSRERYLGGYALNPSLEAVAVRDGSGFEDCMVVVSLRPLPALMTRNWVCHGNTKYKGNGGHGEYCCRTHTEERGSVRVVGVLFVISQTHKPMIVHY